MTAPVITTAPADPEARTGAARTWAIVVGCLIVIVGLTVWLRYRPIGISSLWLDDAWVGVGARFPTVGDTISSGLTSPGFSLLYRGWSTVLGSGATTAQLLALGFGIAAPVVLFVAATERGLPWYAGLLGAGLLATAPAHIEMSVHLKQYTAEAFAMTVVLWVAWRVIDQPGAPARWGAFAAVATAASLLSSVGALAAGSAFAVCILATVLARPRRLGPMLWAIAASAVVVLPWLLLAVQPNVHGKLTDYWRNYYLDSDGFAGGLGTRLGAVARAFQDVPSGIVIVALIVAAVIVLVRRPLVGLLLVVPTVLAVGLAAFSAVPLGTGRTDIYLFPTYALLVAVAVAEVASMIPARSRVAVGAAAVVGVLLVALVAPQATTYFVIEDLTPLVHTVERQRAPGDQIVVYPSSGYAYGIATRYPIEKRSDPLAPTDWVVDVQGPDITVLEAHRQDPEKWAGPLDRITAGSPRVWVIGSHLFPGPAPKFFRDWEVLASMLQDRGYKPVGVQNRVGALLVQYAKDPASASRP